MTNPTDFNDLAIAADLEEVNRQVAQAVQEVRPAPESPAYEWPDPHLPGALRTPAIPPDILPTWLGDMARAVSEATQTPPALAVMCCLSVLGVVLQGRFEVEPQHGYREPLSIWTLGTAPPGARKTAIMNAVMAPLIHWEKLLRDRMRSEIAKVNATRAVAKKRVEKLLHDAAKAKDASEREAIRAEIEREEIEMPEELRAPRLFTGDITGERLQGLLVEHSGRMAVLSDEGGIFLNMAGLYNGGSANNDVFLQGHAGSAMRVDRAGRLAHIDKPALTFGLLLQPATLADVASSPKFRNSGLLARFLYGMPPSNVGTRDMRKHAPIPEGVKAAYEYNLMKLLEGVPGTAQAPAVLPLTDAARDHWLDLAEEIERHQGDGGQYEPISDWTSKLPGAVARIAGLFELAEVGLHAEEVSHSAMVQAVRLGRLLIPHAQAAFGLLGADEVDSDALAVLKWIRATGRQEFTRREAQKAQESRFRSVERLQKALARLAYQDVLREFKHHFKGVRPTVAYQVNPKALSSNAAVSQ